MDLPLKEYAADLRMIQKREKKRDPDDWAIRGPIITATLRLTEALLGFSGIGNQHRKLEPEVGQSVHQEPLTEPSREIERSGKGEGAEMGEEDLFQISKVLLSIVKEAEGLPLEEYVVKVRQEQERVAESDPDEWANSGYLTVALLRLAEAVVGNWGAENRYMLQIGEVPVHKGPVHKDKETVH